MFTKRFRFVAVLCAAFLPAAASCARNNRAVDTSIEYEVINKSITITKYIGKGTDVNIPASIEGLPVTVIRDDAFYNCDSLTNINVAAGNSAYSSIDGVLFDKSGQTLICYPPGRSGVYTVPSSVSTVKHSAFWNCRNLIGVTVPSSVFIIGDYAFFDCCSLISINTSSSLTIKDSAFQGCNSLTDIDVDMDNSTYSSVDGILFDKSGQTLICYPAGKNGAYTVPSSVITIGDRAFSECGNLTSVTVPSSVFIIKDSEFDEKVRIQYVDND